MGSSRVGSNPTRSVLVPASVSMLMIWKASWQMTRGLAKIAQVGERQTEDLKVSGSIPGFRIMQSWHLPSVLKRVGTRAISQAAKIER